MPKTGTRPAERQNRSEKSSQIIYVPMLCVLSYVSLADRAKNERMRELAIERVDYI